MFNLEGVNLRGVYINPLQKLSMEHWQKDLLDVEKLKEKKLKEETLKTLKNKHLELEAYAKKQQEILPVKSAKPTRPAMKKDEFEHSEPQTVPARSVPEEKPEEKPTAKPDNILLPHRIRGQVRPLKPKEKKNKNRT